MCLSTFVLSVTLVVNSKLFGGWVLGESKIKWKFSIAQRVGVLNPHIVQGSTALQTGWLKTIEMYSFIVLEARVQNQKVRIIHSFWGLWERTVPCFLLTSSDGQHSLACRCITCITSISACIFTWHSLYVIVSSPCCFLIKTPYWFMVPPYSSMTASLLH